MPYTVEQLIEELKDHDPKDFAVISDGEYQYHVESVSSDGVDTVIINADPDSEVL
jgi:hypothetical protein